MHAPTDNATPLTIRPLRLPVRSRQYRHPRVGCACALPVELQPLLGVLLLASGYWLGPLAWLGVLPLTGAALIFWTAYRPAAQRPGLACSIRRTEGELQPLLTTNCSA